jgi:aminoglycoside 6'-N-acetyltransferase I
MALAFVRLTADNIERFVPLYVAVFNAPPWNDSWTEVAVDERLMNFAMFPAFDGLGMLLDDEPVALALGWSERWFSSWIFQIKEFCVATDRQRSGLGKSLMAEFECHLAAQGFSGVYLQTGENAPARRFYESLEYERFGVVSLRKRLLPVAA